MIQVVERVEAHYEAQKVPYGTVYKWCSECLLLECDCGERMECKSPACHCRCGADLGAVFENPNPERQEAPWRQEQHWWPAESAGHRESDYWLELRELE